MEASLRLGIGSGMGLPALVSLLSRLLTGVGDEAKSFPAFHRKSDLTATLSAFIQLPATKPYA